MSGLPHPEATTSILYVYPDPQNRRQGRCLSVGWASALDSM